MRDRRLAMAGFCGMLVLAGVARAQPVAVPPQLAACQTCHAEAAGNASAMAPRLNGQPAEYLAARMRSFRDPTRQSAHATYFMFDVNAGLPDAQVMALAQYFSAQPAPAGAGKGPLAQRGQQLYQMGVGQDVAPCQTCHGAQGEGARQVPRLAGQRGAYLRQQMENFSFATRVHDTMNPHARSLTHEEIMALVAYLAND